MVASVAMYSMVTSLPLLLIDDHLPDKPEPLYIVASWLPGVEDPLILLTTLVVLTPQQARQILWYYKQRWACEEASRFRRQTKFVYYRLLDGLQNFSRLYQPRGGKIPLEPLRNG